jgi:hypothetical protein
MESLDNRQPNVPKAEQSCLLSSNNGVSDCSALGFEYQEPPIEVLLDQLAEILVEAYFYEKRNTN